MDKVKVIYCSGESWTLRGKLKRGVSLTDWFNGYTTVTNGKAFWRKKEKYLWLGYEVLCVVVSTSQDEFLGRNDITTIYHNPTQILSIDLMSAKARSKANRKEGTDVK